MSSHAGLGEGRPSHAMQMAGMLDHSQAYSSHPDAGPRGNDTSPADCGRRGDHDSCRLPCTPRQCSMTVCDVSVTAAAIVSLLPREAPIVLALPSPALRHQGPAFAPELPPPRV